MLIHQRAIGPNILNSVPSGNGTDTDIFIHRKVLEYPATFRNQYRTQLYHLGTEQIGDVFISEFNVPFPYKAIFRFQQPTDGPQCRSFPRAVGAKQRNDAPFRNIHADTAQHLNNVVINDFYVIDFELIIVFFLIHKAAILNPDN